MKLLFNLLLVILFSIDHGAYGVDTVSVSVSVIEGDSVTLHTGVQTNQVRIEWYYKKTRIAQIYRNQSKVCTDVQCSKSNVTERFRDRLKLDNQTGSLTIRNTTTEDSGDYTQKIINSGDHEKIFSVSVHGVFAVEVSVSVMEGDPVTLQTGVQTNQQDRIRWYYNDTVIAEITGDQSQICTDDQCKERFRDRLKLDHWITLTITHTRTEDSGEYKLQMMINNSNFSITRVKRFSVSVTGSGLSSSVPDSGLSSSVPGSGLSSSVPGSGLSSGAKVGIVVVVLLVFAAVAGIYYHHHRRHTAVPQNEGNDDDNPPAEPDAIPLRDM